IAVLHARFVVRALRALTAAAVDVGLEAVLDHIAARAGVGLRARFAGLGRALVRGVRGVGDAAFAELVVRAQAGDETASRQDEREDERVPHHVPSRIAPPGTTRKAACVSAFGAVRNRTAPPTASTPPAANAIVAAVERFHASF